MTDQHSRGAWASRIGFILAASGSAIGLGNIWKFPYIVGENGGGYFVILYLVAILLVGSPIMVAEVLVGRIARTSPMDAFDRILGARTAWRGVGVLSAFTGFAILSYYSVVAGWSLHYLYLSLMNAFEGLSPDAIAGVFAKFYANGGLNLFWHFIFMVLTLSVVQAGVSRGIELAAKIIMPALLLMLLALLIYASTLPGFKPSLDFLFRFELGRVTAAGALEAVGHSFFTLSVGMGAIMTYGSYLRQKDDAVGSALTIAGLDTMVGMAATLILFPILLTAGLETKSGPGLVFVSIPLALSQFPGGQIWMICFFFLLFFAALSSAISLMEVVAASAIDSFHWPRKSASWILGIVVFLLGVPSALSGGDTVFGKPWASIFGRNFFDLFDHLASNWMLPIGGLFISLFVGWFMPADLREQGFKEGSRLAALYPVWLFILRFIAPIGLLTVFLAKLGS